MERTESDGGRSFSEVRIAGVGLGDCARGQNSRGRCPILYELTRRFLERLRVLDLT